MLSRFESYLNNQTLRKAAGLMLLVPLVATLSFGQVGHTLSGVGPVDQSWAGAGTANPQDFMGALYWNPASINAFDGTRVALGLQFLMPTTDQPARRR